MKAALNSEDQQLQDCRQKWKHRSEDKIKHIGPIQGQQKYSPSTITRHRALEDFNPHKILRYILHFHFHRYKFQMSTMLIVRKAGRSLNVDPMRMRRRCEQQREGQMR